MSKNKGIARIGFYVPSAVKDELQARAQHEGITLSALLRPYLRPISKGELTLKAERVSSPNERK